MAHDTLSRHIPISIPGASSGQNSYSKGGESNHHRNHLIHSPLKPLDTVDPLPTISPTFPLHNNISSTARTELCPSSPFSSMSHNLPRSKNWAAAWSGHLPNKSVFIRDTILGFADGLTVPFALCAGLSSLKSSRLVILAGLAELFSGAISMGLGCYLAAVTEAKGYEVLERRLIERFVAKEDRGVSWQGGTGSSVEQGVGEDDVYEVLRQYGVGRNEAGEVVKALSCKRNMWIKVMESFFHSSILPTVSLLAVQYCYCPMA